MPLKNKKQTKSQSFAQFPLDPHSYLAVLVYCIHSCHYQPFHLNLHKSALAILLNQLVSPSHFHAPLSFSSSLARFRYLSPVLLSFNYTLWSDGTAKSTIRHYLLTVMRSGPLVEFRWHVYISKSQKSLCILFSKTDSGLCIYHLFVRSNFNFLHNSLWITFPTQKIYFQKEKSKILQFLVSTRS